MKESIIIVQISLTTPFFFILLFFFVASLFSLYMYKRTNFLLLLL